MSLTEFDQEEYDRNRRREVMMETASNMLARNYPVADIAEITGLSVEDVKALSASPLSPASHQNRQS